MYAYTFCVSSLWRRKPHWRKQLSGRPMREVRRERALQRLARAYQLFCGKSLLAPSSSSSSSPYIRIVRTSGPPSTTKWTLHAKGMRGSCLPPSRPSLLSLFKSDPVPSSLALFRTFQTKRYREFSVTEISVSAVCSFTENSFRPFHHVLVHPSLLLTYWFGSDSNVKNRNYRSHTPPSSHWDRQT